MQNNHVLRWSEFKTWKEQQNHVKVKHKMQWQVMLYEFHKEIEMN